MGGASFVRSGASYVISGINACHYCICIVPRNIGGVCMDCMKKIAPFEEESWNEKYMKRFVIR